MYRLRCIRARRRPLLPRLRKIILAMRLPHRLVALSPGFTIFAQDALPHPRPGGRELVHRGVWLGSLNTLDAPGSRRAAFGGFTGELCIAFSLRFSFEGGSRGLWPYTHVHTTLQRSRPLPRDDCSYLAYPCPRSLNASSLEKTPKQRVYRTTSATSTTLKVAFSPLRTRF